MAQMAQNNSILNANKTNIYSTLHRVPSLPHQLLNHWAAKGIKGALGLTSVLARYEHAQVDQPCGSVELREDSLDTEVVFVAWRRLNSLDDDVADNGLYMRLTMFVKIKIML